MSRYETAREIYAKYRIDTDQAILSLKAIPVSIHCWQGDDVSGFEHHVALSGGIQVTGNFPGKARNFEELIEDFLEASKHIPGKKRINLHTIYAVSNGAVARDQLRPENFDAWLDFAKKNDFMIDFNPTFFAHSMVKDNLTLSSPTKKYVRFG